MINKHIDLETASAIQSILHKLNISHSRVVIDLDKRTVETEEDDCSINDLLEAAGALSKERGKELLDEVKSSREDWDA